MTTEQLIPPRQPAAGTIVCVVMKPPISTAEVFLGRPQSMKVVDIVARQIHNGKPASWINLQLRGTKIVGAIPQEGQWLEIRPADINEHGRVRRLRNLSTGHEVSTRTNGWWVLLR